MPVYGHVILSSGQIRMARAALNWTIEELSREAGISEKTIRRLEKPNTRPNMTVGTCSTLTRAFERNGVTFIAADESGQGAGVRIRG